MIIVLSRMYYSFFDSIIADFWRMHKLKTWVEEKFKEIVHVCKIMSEISNVSETKQLTQKI